MTSVDWIGIGKYLSIIVDSQIPKSALRFTEISIKLLTVLHQRKRGYRTIKLGRRQQGSKYSHILLAQQFRVHSGAVR